MFYIKYLEEGHLNFTRNTKIWTIREQRKEIVIKTSYHIKFQFILHKTTAQKKIVFVAFFSWNILKAIWLFLSVHCTRKGWKWKGKIIIRWIFSSLDEIFLLFFFQILKTQFALCCRWFMESPSCWNWWFMCMKNACVVFSNIMKLFLRKYRQKFCTFT